MKVTVASGKGGTGKTTVALSLFQAASKVYGGKSYLVDCDVEEPNDLLFFPTHSPFSSKTIYKDVPQIDTSKCTFCRECADYCEFNAIVVLPSAEFAEVNKDLCHSCGACLHACKHEAITEIQEEIGEVKKYNIPYGSGLTEGRMKVGSSMQTMLIRELKKTISKGHDITIYDAPPGTSCPVVETISGSDYVILVAEPTPFGLHDFKLMVELMQEIKIPYGVIINKAGTGDRKIYDFLNETGITLLGEIPFSKQFASSYAAGSILESKPEEFQEAIDSIALNLKQLLT
jgi:MinD superfamily P-loop ATPase